MLLLPYSLPNRVFRLLVFLLHYLVNHYQYVFIGRDFKALVSMALDKSVCRTP